jgi:hypothetical protein
LDAVGRDSVCTPIGDFPGQPNVKFPHRSGGMRFTTTLDLCLATVVLLQQGGLAQTSSPPPQQAHNATSADEDLPIGLPPMKKGGLSLIGGTVVKMDPIRDRLVLRAFGGKDVTVGFDVRTKVLRDETSVPAREVQTGARVYADTTLVNGQIFAKTIRLVSNAQGEANGQVIAYDPSTRKLKIRNSLGAEPLELSVSAETSIHNGERPGEASELLTGTLVHVSFRPKDHVNAASKIDILAQPGSMSTFAGKMTFVDLRTNLVAIADQSGVNTYEVAIDKLPRDVKQQLREGKDVIVHAQFDGKKYEAQTIDFAPVR